MPQISRPNRPGTLAHELIDRIREAIVDGRYAPGQRLIEADLMRELQASRGSVREALRRLGAEGIVDLVPNRGAVVRKLSRKDFCDLFRMREALEGLAARMAAERVAAHGLAEPFLAAAAATAEADDQGAAAFSRQNRTLHQLIVDFSDNAQLAESLEQMRIPLARLHIRSAVDASYRDDSRDEHKAVIAAIAAGDADAAETAMRQHLRQAASRVLAIVDSELARPAA
ncbi:GntR family transcriptional regulator [Verticiella sediminum]|nr:GntR family transcriptional regulator [Verticiella sediminum]